MIHVQHAENRQLDMARFNEAFMMHTSTSPQYGIIASCDVAAAMMEQPAGRALVQETIDEALSFRRAMAAVREQLDGAWWFDVWQPETDGDLAADERAQWVLKPGDRWHGFEGLAENHVLVDPIKVTILSPGLVADGTMQELGIPAAVVTKFLSSRRIEIEKTGLYSFLVLFSMGITKGKWSTLVTELINFKDLYDSNAPLRQALPALAEAHPDAYAKMGLKDLCDASARSLSRRQHAQGAAGTCTRRCPRWRCGRPMPTTISCAGSVESVEIDNLMGRILAVMVVPYPPGIPLIMPGERITPETKSIYDYLLYAREFDKKFPGFETDIHGLRFESTAGDRRYLIDCVT